MDIINLTSVTHEAYSVIHEAYQLTPYSTDSPISISPFGQAELHLCLELKVDGRYFHVDRKIQFDIRIFYDQVEARTILTPFVHTVANNPFSVNLYPNELLDYIIHCGVRLAMFAFNFPGYSVYPLAFMVTGIFEEHPVQDPDIIIDDNGMEDILDSFGRYIPREDIIIDDNGMENILDSFGMHIPGEDMSIENMLKKVRIASVGENCAVCLEELEVGSDASMMPCNHAFHGTCIQRWLKQSPSCPLCRFKMPPQTS